MKTRSLNWTKAMIFGCAIYLLQSCNQSNEPAGKGEVEFQITDSPSDDANVKRVLVTIADIKVDGQSISGFTKQTIDLKAYQEGSTKILGTTQLTAKQYSNLTLVLDADTDADGHVPGCYVLATDDMKYKLASGSKIEILLNKSWSVPTGSKTGVVLDFDIRKSIRAVDDPSIRYNFVSNSNLQAAIRVANRENTGTLKGTYSEQIVNNADMTIVYVYKKGTFNASTETQAQGDDAVLFSHAIASAEVKTVLAAKTYQLAFVEKGDYELHFVAYNKEASTQRFVFANVLTSQTSVEGSSSDFISIDGGATLLVSSVITGTL